MVNCTSIAQRRPSMFLSGLFQSLNRWWPSCSVGRTHIASRDRNPSTLQLHWHQWYFCIDVKKHCSTVNNYACSTVSRGERTSVQDSLMLWHTCPSCPRMDTNQDSMGWNKAAQGPTRCTNRRTHTISSPRARNLSERIEDRGAFVRAHPQERWSETRTLWCLSVIVPIEPHPFTLRRRSRQWEWNEWDTSATKVTVRLRSRECYRQWSIIVLNEPRVAAECCKWQDCSLPWK